MGGNHMAYYGFNYAVTLDLWSQWLETTRKVSQELFLKKDTYHTSLRNLVEMRLIEKFFNTVILIYLWSTEA